MTTEIIIFFAIGVLVLAAVQLLIGKLLLGNSSSTTHDTLIANTEQILEQQRQIMTALNIKSNPVKSNPVKINDMKSDTMKSSDIKSNDMNSSAMKSSDMKNNALESNALSGAQDKKSPETVLPEQPRVPPVNPGPTPSLD